MIDAKTIEELRGLLAKATPGQWRLRPQFSLRIVEVQGPREAPVVKRGGFDESQRSYNGHKANAALIVAMRNALPDLLDAAERLERQVRAKQQEIEEIAARAQENYERALAAERLASRAREEALREAIEICKEADAQDDRDNGAAATGAACNAANAILALINKPKGGDANEGRSGTTRETRHPATSPGVTAGASGEAKQVDPDWFWCEIDPDESGDSAYQAMFTYRPRLEPVELCTSYVGPRLWGVMSPPLPDADNDEETAHTFGTREAAQAFCDERNAIFNGAALCPSEGADRG